MLRNMLDGDGQDQYDSGGWCFPKPIPPSNKNDGQTRVLEPMMPQNTNEYFEENLREYPDEDPRQWQKHTKEWESVQGGSILTICKLHPSQRPPMVRPEDDNEVCRLAHVGTPLDAGNTDCRSWRFGLRALVSCANLSLHA